MDDNLPLITHDIVKIAVDEYALDPIQIYIRNACQLDKAILCCIYRHMKATGHQEFGFEIIWERLQDFLEWVHSKQILLQSVEPVKNGSSSFEKITLLMPPYELFEAIIFRLVERGLLFKKKTKLSWILPRTSIFVLAFDFSTIISALRSTSFESYVSLN